MKIPLETVKIEWAKTRGLREVAFLAKYYGIFKHVFKGKEFKPQVWLDVNYENTRVHRGNIIQPSEVHLSRFVDPCTTSTVSVKQQNFAKSTFNETKGFAFATLLGF